MQMFSASQLYDLLAYSLETLGKLRDLTAYILLSAVH